MQVSERRIEKERKEKEACAFVLRDNGNVVD